MVTIRRLPNGETAIYAYPYNRALECIERRVEEILKAALRRVAKEVDPNWLKLEIDFPESGFTPSNAALNGPQHGNTDLLSHERMGDPDIRALFMHYGVRKPKGFTLYNERHRIELIPGRTEVGYEHCESGVVYSVEPEGRFTVFITEGHTKRLCEERLETLRRNLDLEHANDAPEYDLVDNSGLTFTSMVYLSQPVALPQDEDLPLETQEHRETQRLSWEKTRFDNLRRSGNDW